jgi:hypothetical protein
MGLLPSFRQALEQLRRLERRAVRIQEALGRIEASLIAARGPGLLAESEFRVFSQWGEDGLVERLVSQVRVDRQIFIEFGVENYEEANTRFLLIHRNWSGLVLDGSPQNVAHIKGLDLYWQHNLKAACAFVTRENINQLLRDNGVQGEVGLLSIDIDGNDYWVWEAIDVVTPAIVVVEYNSRFGPARAVTVPYRPDFDRNKAHWSMIYYGASLAALCRLASRKGYALVGCNAAGNNAFFVRQDRLPPEIKALTPEEGYVRNRFREARDRTGQLAFLSADEEARILEELALVEV